MAGGINRLSVKECEAFVERARRAAEVPPDLEQAPAHLCIATRKDGAPCQAFAQPGRLTCRGHDTDADREGRKAERQLSDGGGLYLTLTPAGTAVWRVKYRLGKTAAGKLREGLFAVGVFPAISLAKAREAREFVKAEIREGRNPVTSREAQRSRTTTENDTTVAKVAEAWLEAMTPGWSPLYAKQVRRLLYRDALPAIGRKPMTAVEDADIRPLLEGLIRRGAPSQAEKMYTHLKLFFDDARDHGVKLSRNPVTDCARVLEKLPPRAEAPALRTFTALGDLLRRTEAANLSPSVRMALRLLAFTGGGSRPGNVVRAEWSEFDLDPKAPAWSVPREKMKYPGYSHAHRIFLGPTIAQELRQWRAVTGGTGYLFVPPHGKGPHISLEALEKVYRETLGMRGVHSPHGWRSAISTLAHEAGHDSVVIELHLDHVDEKKIRKTYNKAVRMPARRKLSDWWDAKLVTSQYGKQPAAKAPRKSTEQPRRGTRAS